MKDLEKLALPLLDKAFSQAQEKYFSLSPMREMLAYHYESGGKRIRPLLAFGAALERSPLQGTEKDELIARCVPYALGVELIHNATLIHDDIQDGDRARRGKETLWVKYSSAQAINCGDAWFFVPQLLIQDASYPAELKLKLLKLLQEKTLAVIEGQSQEFSLKERFSQAEEISVHQYLSMAEGKTSALFSMPLLGGAMIAGASGVELEDLEECARHLGHAFQIQDDLLDLWGDKGRGVSGSDIAEGKLSFPLVLLLSGLERESDMRKRVESVVRAPREETGAEDVHFVISAMEEAGVKDRAISEFRGHLKAARETKHWKKTAEYLGGWLEEKVKAF